MKQDWALERSMLAAGKGSDDGTHARASALDADANVIANHERGNELAEQATRWLCPCRGRRHGARAAGRRPGPEQGTGRGPAQGLPLSLFRRGEAVRGGPGSSAAALEMVVATTAR